MADFVLVGLPYKGQRSRSEDVIRHFVGRVVALEEDGRITLDYLRLRSSDIKEVHHFPKIGDMDTVDRSLVLGVLTVNTGTTQRQSGLFRVVPPLDMFNIQ